MTVPMVVNLQRMFATMPPLSLAPISEPVGCKINTPEELATFLSPALQSKIVTYERFLEGPLRITYFDRRNTPQRFLLDGDEMTRGVGNLTCSLAMGLVYYMRKYMSLPPFPDVTDDIPDLIKRAVGLVALSDRAPRQFLRNKYYEVALESLKLYAKYVEGPSIERIEAANLIEECEEITAEPEEEGVPVYDTRCLKRNFRVLIAELMQAAPRK